MFNQADRYWKHYKIDHLKNLKLPSDDPIVDLDTLYNLTVPMNLFSGPAPKSPEKTNSNSKILILRKILNKHHKCVCED